MLKSIFECVTGVRSLRCPQEKNDRTYICERQVMKVVRKIVKEGERASERRGEMKTNFQRQELSQRSGAVQSHG